MKNITIYELRDSLHGSAYGVFDSFDSVIQFMRENPEEFKPYIDLYAENEGYQNLSYDYYKAMDYFKSIGAEDLSYLFSCGDGLNLNQVSYYYQD